MSAASAGGRASGRCRGRLYRASDTTRRVRHRCTCAAGSTVFGVAREDVGEGADPKAAFSDAVKRAAVHFGVGRVLYAMRAPWLRAGDGDGELRRDGRGVLFVDERTEAWCREKYERWLAERGAAEFGEPLDHGVEGTGVVSDAETVDRPEADATGEGAEQGSGGNAATKPGGPELREVA